MKGRQSRLLMFGRIILPLGARIYEEPSEAVNRLTWLFYFILSIHHFSEHSQNHSFIFTGYTKLKHYRLKLVGSMCF